MEFGGEMFPVGVYFDPTDSELIYYLKKKIYRRRLPTGIIKDIPYLYHYPPELLPIGEFEHGRENGAYYFTNNGKKPLDGEVKLDGEWKSNGPEEAVSADNEIVGFKIELYLYRRDKKTGWVIKEYRYNPNMVPAHRRQKTLIRDLIQNYVVLHIKFDPDLRDNFSAEEAFTISMEEAKDLDFS